jgi:uncharacterized membrane protein
MRMTRSLLYGLSGLLLGVIIHLVVILTLPILAPNGVVRRIDNILPDANRTVLFGDIHESEPNPLRLDPDLTYALCRLNLKQGPGEVVATLPTSFWSVAVFDRDGTVIYSTTNRDGIGQSLDMGVFDPGQTRLLAEQKIDINAGLLIVEAKSDDVFVLVRLAPPHAAVRARYQSDLSRLNCRNIKI